MGAGGGQERAQNNGTHTHVVGGAAREEASRARGKGRKHARTNQHLLQRRALSGSAQHEVHRRGTQVRGLRIHERPELRVEKNMPRRGGGRQRRRSGREGEKPAASGAQWRYHQTHRLPAPSSTSLPPPAPQLAVPQWPAHYWHTLQSLSHRHTSAVADVPHRLLRSILDQ